MDIRVRLARRDDLKLAHTWANDPVNIRMNAKGGEVPLESFARLFAELLHDKDTILLVIEGLWDSGWVPVAQVRLDTDGEMSILIDRGYRGRRLATPVILASIEFARDMLPLNTVTAKIRLDNLASIKAFERAGFEAARTLSCKGHACVEYAYRLPSEPE